MPYRRQRSEPRSSSRYGRADIASASRAVLPIVVLAAIASAQSGDWPQWGRDPTRNMVADVQGLPDRFDIGRFVGGTSEIDIETAKNVRWIARLGSECYGNPTVAGGRVFVGTNNESPRDPRFTEDRSCVYCLDEATGDLLWQLCAPKLGTGMVSDWELLGMCTSPAVDGDRVYLVTNRCEVVCLDASGLVDGNDGPFMDEGRYLAGPDAPPMEIQQTDADIVWVTSMIDECGVAPHNITSSSVLVVGDRVYASTSNGIDVDHERTPAPDAPGLIVLDKNTGRIIGREATGMSRRLFHGNWSSPAYLKTDAAELVVFGGPDGFVYAFEPEPVLESDRGVLVEAWRFDCNRPEYRHRDGEPIAYGTRKGPSEVVGTPVVHGGRVYALIGQDPDHGPGVGNLVCIDAGGEQVWSYAKIGRSTSTVSIADGLLFAADYSGRVHCLDAATGEEHWVHDTGSYIWGSTLVADGRVFVGTEDGFLTILPATRECAREAVVEVDFAAPIYSSPIAAGGVLYVATQMHLFAIAKRAN